MPEVPQNPLEFFLQNAAAIGPSLHLILWGMVILCWGFWSLPGNGGGGLLNRFLRLFQHPAVLAVGGLTMASLQLYRLWGVNSGPAFYKMITLDSFALYFDMLFLVAALLVVIMSYKYLDIEEEQHTEYYALILFATAGMMFMAGAIDLVSLFLGLELMSISTSVLVGFLRGKKRSNEASLKYFLLGAFSTGIILYGMSLVYGLGGSTNLNEIGRQIAQLEDNSLLTLSLLMLMAGLCFKIAAVPFHMWVPDAYEGAPTPITAFMSVAVKAAGFAIFFRILFVAFEGFWELYVFPLALISMVTITLGNVAALTQENVKRLLAYSSISHAGFVLMGVVAGTERGITASAIYLLAYTFMNLGIWAGVILLRRKDIPGERVEDFDGLFFRHPAVAILMLVFFLSLAGIPPLAGFIAKYYVFTAVLEVAFTQGEPYSSLMVWLAVVGALNVVVSIFYYLRIVVSMFMKTEYLPVPLSFSKGLVVVLVITGFFTLLIGVYPEPFIQLAQFVNLPLI